MKTKDTTPTFKKKHDALLMGNDGHIYTLDHLGNVYTIDCYNAHGKFMHAVTSSTSVTFIMNVWDEIKKKES